MAVRPVDLQAPLPQADEVARVQRVPQAASEREASAAVVQGQPEVRERQRDVAHSPDVTPEEAESDRRRRKKGTQDPRRGRAAPAGDGAADGGDTARPAEDEAIPPAKGAHVDLRGL